jgi:hypothetical protein
MTDNQEEDNYGITIRPITELSELRKCIDLQRETWGLADVEIVPLRMLVTQKPSWRSRPWCIRPRPPDWFP